MKTRALLLLALPAALLSCTRENRASVTVQSICHPADDSKCAFAQGKCDATLLGTPALDVGQVPAITLYLQVENQLTDNTNKDAGQLNTNGAHVNQIVVAYESYGLSRDVFDVGNQNIPAAGSTVISVTFPNSTDNMLALMSAFPPGGFGTLNAKIKLRGYFDDGSSFETGDFATGVTVCNGCIPQPQCVPPKIPCPYAGMEPVACSSTS
jgi:hypothetical protein